MKAKDFVTLCMKAETSLAAAVTTVKADTADGFAAEVIALADVAKELAGHVGKKAVGDDATANALITTYAKGSEYLHLKMSSVRMPADGQDKTKITAAEIMVIIQLANAIVTLIRRLRGKDI